MRRPLVERSISVLLLAALTLTGNAAFTIRTFSAASWVNQTQQPRQAGLAEIDDSPQGPEPGPGTDQIDALARTTRYVHDNLGRRINRVLPLGQTETLGYDRVGNLAARQDFNGKITTFQYDELNRLKFRIPDASFAAPTIGFTYWPSGQRKTMSDASGTTSYYYDDRDRLQQKDTPQGTLAYTWDNQSNLQSIASESTALGTAVSYRYDELNRLQNVIDANVGTTTYGYDDVGNMQTVDAPNAVRHLYAYDPLNRLGTLTVSNLAGAIVQHSYTKAPTGHRRSHGESWQQLPAAGTFGGSVAYTRTAAYVYDDLWRLRNETIGSTAPAALNVRTGSIGYDLDAVGNRRARTSTVSGIGNQNFAYDANDRLLGDTPDNNGNTLVGTVSASGGGDPLKTVAGTFTYDDRIGTAQTTIASSPAAIGYVYDGDGNKVAQTINGTTTTYLVDSLNPSGYAQVVEERTNGTTTRAYVWGHMLIAQVIGPTRTFYGFDGHGNVRLITDETGTVTDRYTYEAFGVLIGAEGGTPNAHLYCGERFDSTLGQYYLRARTMNPLTGRFWTMDRFEGPSDDPSSLHKYLYANSDPANATDPTGEEFNFATLQSTLFNIAIRAVPHSPSVGSFFFAVSRINYAAVATFYNRIQGISAYSLSQLNALYQSAQAQYSHLVGLQKHHIIPTYIQNALTRAGMAIPDQFQRITVSIPYAYHRVLHNALYQIFPPGDPFRGQTPNVPKLMSDLEAFYTMYPLP